MSKYSLLFETDEYREIGPFRFPVYHDFTPGENRAFDKLNKEFARGTYNSMSLAKRMAQDHGIKPTEALKILGSISSEENQEYLFEYAEEVQDLADGVLNENEQRARVVTFFMQRRGEVCLDGEWERASDWTQEDTDKIPGQMIREIYDFIMAERNGDDKAGKEQTPSPTETPKRRMTTSSTSN